MLHGRCARHLTNSRSTHWGRGHAWQVCVAPYQLSQYPPLAAKGSCMAGVRGTLPTLAVPAIGGEGAMHGWCARHLINSRSTQQWRRGRPIQRNRKDTAPDDTAELTPDKETVMTAILQTRTRLNNTLPRGAELFGQLRIGLDIKRTHQK